MVEMKHYEKLRTVFFNSQKNKAQRQYDYWERRNKRTPDVQQQMTRHAMEVQFYEDALQALKGGGND